MNPESDATAIWLEQKFDVPDSGNWESDSVFSMPLAKGEASRSQGSPGVIVFECTPLEGVQDEIERYFDFSLFGKLTRDSHGSLMKEVPHIG